MIKNKGFSLVELIIFVIILSIVSATILVTVSFALRYIPISHNQTVTPITASKCMDYLLGQRYLKDFNFDGHTTCNTGDEYSITQSFCDTPNMGTTIKVKCTAINGVQAFKLITVTTNTAGRSTSAGATILNLLIADY